MRCCAIARLIDPLNSPVWKPLLRSLLRTVTQSLSRHAVSSFSRFISQHALGPTLRALCALLVLGAASHCYACKSTSGCTGAPVRTVTAFSAQTAGLPAGPHTWPDASSIRKHRFAHFDDKLAQPAQALHEQCKYESDISTAPPARRVALTFDDGPQPGQTEIILEVLARHHIRASFFMIGHKAQQHPELVALVRAAGHLVIANHSWDHPNFHSISVQAQAQEVIKTETALAGDLQPLKLFRYPYGNSSCETNALLHERGYKIVGWHVDSCDWAFDHSGSVDAKEAATCGVLPQFHSNYAGHVLATVRAHNGGIVLMHEIHPGTVKQLEAIVESIEADGFVFGGVDEPEFASALR